ncbi:hypothetical protein Vadar_011635 [Vaccinium darrowii]|uniref:Uncharacterized protein n=1 Tax=Vaccinium darrowii TaxID=229202 RepID=A0ACB7X977_9ERIC|nr:hypothetical protein Vadar_011635 [Vaccinium darrowii]
MVLVMSVSHKVADAATMIAFAKAWANATTLRSSDEVVPSFKAASLLRPRDPCPINLPFIRRATANKKKNLYIARRYMFHATKIAAIRAKAASSSVQRPTRVEALEKAKDLFAQDPEEKKGFQFDHVWPILKDAEKWLDPLRKETTKRHHSDG